MSSISCVDGLFFQQAPKLMDWMRDAAPVRGWQMTEDDHRRGEVIEALMCGGSAVVPSDLLTAALPELQSLIDGGLASVDCNTVKVLEPLLSRLVAATFDSYRTAGRFSQAV
jgi:coproporphyrinogen III oxidase-like Fe-S oxidoreductase